MNLAKNLRKYFRCRFGAVYSIGIGYKSFGKI
jgi:hypothetical protein